MEFEHKKAGWKARFKEITQGDLERYFQEYRANVKEGTSGSENNGAVVRSAAVAGWFVDESITPEEVANMRPAKVRWLAQCVDRVYAEATSIPPE